MCVMWCATCCVVNVLYSHSFWKGINYRIYSNHLFAPFGVPGQLPGSPWPVDVSMSIRSCKKTRKEKENQFQDHWKPGDSHRKSSFLRPSRWFFQGVPTKKSTTLTSESRPASMNPLGIQWAENFMAFNITSPSHCFSAQKGGVFDKNLPGIIYLPPQSFNQDRQLKMDGWLGKTMFLFGKVYNFSGGKTRCQTSGGSQLPPATTLRHRTTKGHFTGAEMRPKYKATWIDFAAGHGFWQRVRSGEEKKKWSLLLVVDWSWISWGISNFVFGSRCSMKVSVKSKIGLLTVRFPSFQKHTGTRFAIRGDFKVTGKDTLWCHCMGALTFPWWIHSLKLTARHLKMKLVFQPSIFRCENVSFREGIFDALEAFQKLNPWAWHLPSPPPVFRMTFPKVLLPQNVASGIQVLLSLSWSYKVGSTSRVKSPHLPNF